MLQEKLGPFRGSLLRRRSFKDGPADRDDRGWTPLHVSARKGDLDEVKQLLGDGADANVAAWGPKSKGVTPLHLAAEGGHIRIMPELRVPVDGHRSITQLKKEKGLR